MTRPGKKVVKIVLTGGPVGGKTTAMGLIANWLQGLGYLVLLVKEAATELMRSHVHPVDNWEHPGDFQRAILRYMLATEDVFSFCESRLKTSKPVVILCDRGAPEIEAYVGRPLADEVLAMEGLNRGALFARYHAVIHLVTSANGAREVYEQKFKDNPVRSPEETPERAIELDLATQQAWIGANHLAIVGNGGTSWEDKFEYMKRVVGRVLGIPVPREIERSYLLRPVSGTVIPCRFEEADITQVYLTSPQPGLERRVRRREFSGHTQYFLTHKVNVGDGVREEQEWEITRKDYRDRLAEADPKRRPIEKIRQYFIYEGQYFELDTFITPRPGLRRLEIEVLSMDTPVNLPPFLEIEQEITRDPSFTNSRLALIG